MLSFLGSKNTNLKLELNRLGNSLSNFFCYGFVSLISVSTVLRDTITGGHIK